jgi:hypothetical protein
MRASMGPLHLLPLDHPLAHDLIHADSTKIGSDFFSIPILALDAEAMQVLATPVEGDLNIFLGRYWSRWRVTGAARSSG